MVLYAETYSKCVTLKKIKSVKKGQTIALAKIYMLK